MTETTTQPTAMDEISAAFWEEFLRQNPTSATVYGDTRYDDLLPDPVEGRARGGDRGGPRGGRRGAGDPRGHADGRGPGHPRHARLLADLAERDEALGVVRDPRGRPDLRPPDAAAPGRDVPARRHARGARARGSTACGPTGRSWTRTSRSSTRPAPRAGRRPGSSPSGRSTSSSGSSTRRSRRRSSRRCRRSPRTRTASACARSSATSSTRPTGGTSRRSRASTSRRRASSPGLVSAPDGDAPLPLLHRALDDARARAARRPPGRPRRAGHDRRRAAGDRAAAPATATTSTAYRAALVADPANQPASVEELVARADEDIERAGAIAPRVFGTLPRAGCIVKPVEPFKEKDAPFAYYYPPTIDGTRPGTYYVNTYDLPSRTLSQARRDDVPRGDPGAPLPDRARDGEPGAQRVPAPRARGSSPAPTSRAGACTRSASPTSWACTATTRERLGMLDAQAWRASRLIVDSGMHGLGWSRQQSIDWLLKTGLSETDAIIETDRYIAWPGQALSYMVGMREIRRLRQELEARDGDRFDLKAVPRPAHRARLAAAGHARRGAAALGHARRPERLRRPRPTPASASLSHRRRGPERGCADCGVPRGAVSAPRQRLRRAPPRSAERRVCRQRVRVRGRSHGAGDRAPRAPSGEPDPRSRSRSPARPSPGGTARAAPRSRPRR